jgi:drug/metabolite transporter (DMT)-like permease
MGILLGVLSALLWGVAAVAGGVLARRIGTTQALGWAMLIGLVAAVPLAIGSGTSLGTEPRALVGAVVVTAAGLAGLTLIYAALRLGDIAVVTPISATYGGVAAVFSILAGERLPAVALIALGAAVIGAVLAARVTTATPGRSAPDPRRAGFFAAAAALLWGTQLFIAGQIVDDIGAPWLVAFLRIAGAVVIGLPLLVRGRLRVTRATLLLAAIAGLGEVAGYTLFLYASGYGVAQASVLTSQYAAVAAVIGIVVLGERLQRVQAVGVVMVLAAVVVLATR